MWPELPALPYEHRRLVSRMWRGEGNQSCPRARCARERNIGDFCYLCEQYPCELYEGMGDYDSFVPTRRRSADLDRVRELGPETYVRKLEEKRAILELLVGEWNDGRKKSFYTTAVYLLELDDLRQLSSKYFPFHKRDV